MAQSFKETETENTTVKDVPATEALKWLKLVQWNLNVSAEDIREAMSDLEALTGFKLADLIVNSKNRNVSHLALKIDGIYSYIDLAKSSLKKLSKVLGE